MKSLSKKARQPESIVNVIMGIKDRINQKVANLPPITNYIERENLKYHQSKRSEGGSAAKKSRGWVENGSKEEKRSINSPGNATIAKNSKISNTRNPLTVENSHTGIPKRSHMKNGSTEITEKDGTKTQRKSEISTKSKQKSMNNLGIFFKIS